MRQKLRSTLIYSFMFMISLGLFIAFFGIFSMNKVDKEISGNVRTQSMTSAQGELILTNLLKINYALEVLNNHDDPSAVKLLNNAKQSIVSSMGMIDRSIADEQSKEIYSRLAAEWNYLQIILSSTEDWKSVSSIASLKQETTKMQALVESFVERQKTLTEMSIKKTNSFTTSTRTNMIFILLAAFTLAVAISMFIVRLIQKTIGGDPDMVSEAAKKINTGDLNIDFGTKPEGVYAALQDIVINLNSVVEQANSVASGNYQTEIHLRSKNDRLGMALKQMNENLSKNATNNEEQNWLKDGLNLLAQEISGDLTIQKLADKAISFMGRYINAGKGVLYVSEKEGKSLQLLGSYAFTERDRINNTFQYGEGVIGQVALEKKAIALHNSSPEETEIITGTSAKAAYTFTYPLLYENELFGIIEIASLSALSPIQIDLLNQSSSIIASYLFTAQQKEQIKILLSKAQDSQANAEEKARALQELNTQMEEQQQQLQQQTEELQQSNALMEEQQQQLQQQSEELQQTNAQLEEQQQQTQQQSEELRQTNESLMLTKVALDQRAQELESSNQYKSEFLANMSHELRTPLNSILMLSKMIARNDKGNQGEDDIKKATIIHSSGEELLRLINDILDLSKIEAGKTSLTISQLDSSKMGKELNDYFIQLAQNKNIEFIITNEITQKVMTDQDKVSQIMRNFISNAIKFTNTGSVKVLMTLTKRPNNPVKLEVKDTGVGIPKDNLKLIFEAFHQVDSSISREFGGTGLGLTIAKRLTQSLKGEITLESEIGKGSTFTLWLPLTLNQEQEVGYRQNIEYELPKRTEKPVVQPQVEDATDDRLTLDNSSKVFLVVEDDEIFAGIVESIIHSMNMQCLKAKTASEALNLASSYRLAGIILDLNLPDMSGSELLRKLKSSKELRHIPVQIISSQDKDTNTMEIGALDFIQKPVQEDIIKDAISSLLNISDNSRKQLLIVEDNDIQRNVLVEFIRTDKIEVTGVATENEAMNEIAKGHYDAVIVDLGLGQGNGLNVCINIRKAKFNIPLIVYTGKDLSEAEEKKIKQYADRIIIKTVNSVKRLVDELSIFLNQVKTDNEPLQYAKPGVMDITSTNLEGKRVLIVDDDIKNVFVLSSALEPKGLIVHDAQNGKVGLEMMKQEHYDLVLMDIMMPIMDGYTALKKIREDDDLKHIPVIALTAKALKEDRAKCIDAGANDYIAKPINYDGLLNMITAWIGRRV